MARWFKKTEFSVTYKDFTFEYDTAGELGSMVKESGCKMPNPYDPSNTEFDEYFDGYHSAK